MLQTKDPYVSEVDMTETPDARRFSLRIACQNERRKSEIECKRPHYVLVSSTLVGRLSGL